MALDVDILGMNTLEAIHTRRSVRHYQDKPIAEKIINQLLRAAMQAPSARNEQPWHFIVITDKTLLAEIPRIHPHAAMAPQAAAAILVCGDPELTPVPGYLIQDCCLAAHTILLAAHELRLGAVWTGIYPREERMQAMRALFKIPDRIIPLALIPLGYPANLEANETRQPENRYHEERIHFNGWQCSI